MPTPDDFRALARSSPWLCERAHFTVRSPRDQDVEAWLERPGTLRHRSGSGPVRTTTHAPDTHLLTMLARVGVTTSSVETSLWGRDYEPVRRADGLVLERPSEVEAIGVHGSFDYDDPILGTYEWVAMLNPYELSHDVALTDVREVTHHGRTAWAARCVPEQGYDPKCGCCPLLWSLVSDRDEYGEDEDLSENVYPVAYDVVLDLATGFFVHRAPVWSEDASPASRRDLTLDVEVHSAS